MLDPFLLARAQAAGQADFGVAGAVAVAATAPAVGTADGGAGRSLGRSTGCNSRSQPAVGATSKLAAAGAAADG